MMIGATQNQEIIYLHMRLWFPCMAGFEPMFAH